MKRFPLPPAALAAVLLARTAFAFCGFYVAKADTKLFNKASQVVLVRDEDKTVLTMANDYQGPLKEFAVVIPVPTVITKEQIHVGDKALIDHLDAYSSPRLVEYHDEDPCARRMYEAEEDRAVPAPTAASGGPAARAQALGVKIEARYTVGEYDILILSARESGGLVTWLTESGYRLPSGAEDVLGSYLRQKMHFFVAKVNLGQQERLGFHYLRPLQVAYESPKFMLPIRLGMVNANGPQELFIYTLTRKGRVETTNYRTVKLPSDVEIPLYVREQFGDFYKALFNEQVKKQEMHALFTEYAWDISSCDPCAAEPLSVDELRKLGVFWLNDDQGRLYGGRSAYITRLHVRYDKAHFPDDLVFQETGDQESFQGRYVLRYPWTGEASCEEGKQYREEVRKRQEEEAKTLADLTGWQVEDIRKKMNLGGSGDGKWYQKLWK